MPEQPLHYVYTYNDRDQEFWDEHLRDWLPQRMIDAHIHFVDPVFQIETLSEELRRSLWVMEVSEMAGAETTENYIRTVYPGREVSCVAFAYPNLGWEIESANRYVLDECAKRGWHALALVRPTWVGAQLEHLLKLGFIGVKPYYTLLGFDRFSRDRYLEASIFDFLPHHQLEVLNDYGAWVTLHVPRKDRLGHPENIREVQQIRARYPRIRLVIAHLGRSYTIPHAEEGLLPLVEDEGLFFDNSAVLNPAVHRLALRRIGWRRILYGTDNPIFLMRGRRQWHGRTYINRTSHPFHFNTERESPEIEAQYTLYMYEALKAIKDTCTELGLGREAINGIFYDNAARLLAEIGATRRTVART